MQMAGTLVEIHAEKQCIVLGMVSTDSGTGVRSWSTVSKAGGVAAIPMAMVSRQADRRVCCHMGI